MTKENIQKGKTRSARFLCISRVAVVQSEGLFTQVEAVRMMSLFNTTCNLRLIYSGGKKRETPFDMTPFTIRDVNTAG